MGRSDSQAVALPLIGRVRGVAYALAAGLRILIAVLVVALLGAPIGIVVTDLDRSAEIAGAFVASGLALLGVGLPLVAVLLSRIDWARATVLLGYAPTGGPEVRFREPGTLIRPLAYAVVMLTLGGAVVVLAVLIVVSAGVALASPTLAAIGDQAVIGPFTIRTVPQSVVAIIVALVLLAGLVLISPVLARLHARAALQILARPEQRLERALTSTELSRTRLVRAFDLERRRIERDLHDGVQPQLMSVNMTLGLALAEMPADAPGREDVLRAQHQTQQTIEGLRSFVRNIHPQVLVDHGLGAAVGELADSLVIPITVEDHLSQRLSADLEANLFFCVAELLTNTAKHSGANQASVTLAATDDLVQITVDDDGTGGARTDPRAPGGLDGISDRLAAFDGELTIDSPLGGPTTITLTATDSGVHHVDD